MSEPEFRRGEFLAERAAMIRYHREVDGYSFEQIAAILSCDPTQARLIYQTPPELVESTRPKTVPIATVIGELAELEKRLEERRRFLAEPWPRNKRALSHDEGQVLALDACLHEVRALRLKLSAAAGSADAAHRETAAATPSGEACLDSAQPVAAGSSGPNR